VSVVSNIVVAEAREVRWQAGERLTPEQVAALQAERREAEKRHRLHRYWYAAYERAEWWREFRTGCAYCWLLILGVLAFGMILGYIAHS
jgi:hypothetical protein